jgi:hypothetical protein
MREQEPLGRNCSYVLTGVLSWNVKAELTDSVSSQAS